MLKTVKLHNFKTFLNAEVRFRERHLVIGRNCSGKTNLFKAIQFLSRAGVRDLDFASAIIPGGISEICNWHLRRNEFAISCICELDVGSEPFTFEYKLAIQPASATLQIPAKEFALRVVHEQLTIHGGAFENVALLENDGRKATSFNEEKYLAGKKILTSRSAAPEGATILSKLHDRSANGRAILFRDYLQNWQYYSISPLAIRWGAAQSTEPTDGFGTLDSFGRELSNAIFHLKNVDELRYRRVIEHAQIIEPSLIAIQFLPVPGQTPVPFVELAGQKRASFNGLSDGTLRALALGVIIELGAAFSPPNWNVPCLAMIEEPENGIAPGQLRRLFDLFEEWAPSGQFIFTSHSLGFIDMFDFQRKNVTFLKKSADHTEVVTPPEPAPSTNDDEQLTLSMEYASELLE